MGVTEVGAGVTDVGPELAEAVSGDELCLGPELAEAASGYELCQRELL